MPELKEQTKTYLLTPPIWPKVCSLRQNSELTLLLKIQME